MFVGHIDGVVDNCGTGQTQRGGNPGQVQQSSLGNVAPIDFTDADRGDALAPVGHRA